MADIERKSAGFPDTPAPTLSVNAPSSYFAKEVDTPEISAFESRIQTAKEKWRRLRSVL
jgi:hypothetical protein